MNGTATAHSNAVICSPSNNSVAQYDILGTTFSSIVPNPTSGTTGLSVLQSGNVTVMTWSRGVNNGDASDAQVVVGGLTNVIWAVGSGNTFTGDPHPAMGSTGVLLVNGSSWSNSALLNAGLTLYWNLVGSTFTFQAVYTGTAW